MSIFGSESSGRYSQATTNMIMKICIFCNKIKKNWTLIHIQCRYPDMFIYFEKNQDI